MSVFDLRFLVVIILGVVMVIIFGLFVNAVYLGDSEEDTEIEQMNVSLPFEGIIMERYAGEEGVSPRMEFSEVPENAESLAVVMEDLDSPPTVASVYWVIWNIPPDSSIPEDRPAELLLSKPKGAVQGENGFEEVGYRGPNTVGGTHIYRFEVFALESDLNIPPGSSSSQLRDAMEGKIVGKAEATAGY